MVTSFLREMLLAFFSSLFPHCPANVSQINNLHLILDAESAPGEPKQVSNSPSLTFGLLKAKKIS